MKQEEYWPNCLMEFQRGIKIKRIDITLVIFIIKGYQIFLSPLLGSQCRFTPTCSQYTCESIKKYGLLKGTFMSIRRILRCHPFHPGGFDPVP